MNECEAQHDDKNLICMATQAQYAHSIILSDSVRKYNPNDLTYIRAIGSSVTVLVTHPDNTRTVKDIITHITTGRVTFASGALGLTVLTNYVTTQLGSKDAVIVDYKGTGLLLTDIYGKNVDYAFIPYTVAKNPHLQGQLRIVGALGEDDLVKTNLQDFIPKLDSDVTVFGFVMSSKAERETIDKFTRILNELVRDPVLSEQMKTQGINTNDKRINRLSFQEFARLERQKLTKQLLVMPKN
jgi:tripartite-type tricarboxylate transporter receptor subunit TctC